MKKIFPLESVVWFDEIPEKSPYYLLAKKEPIWMIDPNDSNAYDPLVPNPDEKGNLSPRSKSRLLWYNALPIGNGRLGAMVYGAIEKEIIQINEDTFYTKRPSNYVLDYNNRKTTANTYAGLNTVCSLSKPETLYEAWEQIKKMSLYIDNTPEGLAARQEMETYINNYFVGDEIKQAAYQSFVSLYLDFGHIPEKVENYTRNLDLETAVAVVEYDYESVHFTRENFASAPHQAVVTRLTASGEKNLNIKAELAVWQHSFELERINSNQLIIKGRIRNGGALFYEARLLIDTDGYINGDKNFILITDASYATCCVIGASSYINYENSGDAIVANHRCGKYINELKAVIKNYNYMKAEHISDYSRYYNRSNIKFSSSTKENKPTGERFKNFDSSSDLTIISLYYNYAKYLMISCSREGTQPANLQGLWNGSNIPAWDSKYTININAEMNYWMAQTANLGELEKPFLKTIEELEKPGEKIAKEYYGINDAFVVHHNFDLWRGASIVDRAFPGLWPVGGAWLICHMWDYYLFNNDKVYLKEKTYPLMKKALNFFDKLLTYDPVSGFLISPASVSPEQGGIQPGPTMDHQLIRYLYRITIKAYEVLKESRLTGDADDALKDGWETILSKIAPNQISENGHIKEWIRDVETELTGKSISLSHKHTSHLWDIYPGTSVDPFAVHSEDGKALYDAFHKSLTDRKGENGTGWSIAWRINMWARFCEGNKAYAMLRHLFTFGTYANGFDRHPPFQIDGNFGGAAGVLEMLIQSYNGDINILPSLPEEWKEGSFKGLRARGNFEIGAEWDADGIRMITVISNNGANASVRVYRRDTDGIIVSDKNGKINSEQIKESNGRGTVIISFPTEKGGEYTIKFH